jgi:predicted dienelactone hydrolase
MPLPKNAGVFPLVIVSHGYPGNRFLLSHLTENLASKGYVVVAIDHTDSTFHEFKNFSSTLLNRSLDQLFVLNQMALLNEQDKTGKLTGIIDAGNTALIGYSMGGYGVLNSLGAGVSAKSVSAPTVPNGALQSRAANDPQYLASIDKRIKAAVAFAPGAGMQAYGIRRRWPPSKRHSFILPAVPMMSLAIRPVCVICLNPASIQGAIC